MWRTRLTTDQTPYTTTRQHPLGAHATTTTTTRRMTPQGTDITIMTDTTMTAITTSTVDATVSMSPTGIQVADAIRTQMLDILTCVAFSE
ncbi:hypothetical protein PIIN_03400 [Serendipita indica DSM 11827]|uniref:Uncharacterized protein n=1 Tax=Serendipita indica (strain DSM 11827) TaxID=1109443 RepID=G4TDW3_SERID|nr:hypothetical protein PIIN_03400 [Serendipita indica DSM 11827]